MYSGIKIAEMYSILYSKIPFCIPFCIPRMYSILYSKHVFRDVFQPHLHIFSLIRGILYSKMSSEMSSNLICIFFGMEDKRCLPQSRNILMRRPRCLPICISFAYQLIKIFRLWGRHLRDRKTCLCHCFCIICKLAIS